MANDTPSTAACGPAHPDDRSALDALWAAAFSAPATQRAAWQRVPGRTRVVRVAGAVRAACTLAPLDLETPQGRLRLVWLRALAVEPEWRGRGLASLLVRHARELAARKRAPLALRSAERGLYDRAGLRIAGRMSGWFVPAAALLAADSGDARIRLGRVSRLRARECATSCARASASAVPLPGPRLADLLARHGLRTATPSGQGAALGGREGVAWLAAGDAAVARALLSRAALRSTVATLRVDHWPAAFGELRQAAPRDLGPWWLDAPVWCGDLPAAALACLE